VVRQVGRADADDVMQEILRRVHAAVRSVEDETRYMAWLHRVATNAAIDHHRSRTRDAAKLRAFALEQPSSAAEPENLEELLAPFLSYFVEQLASPYREAVRLTELEGLSMSQAAERERVSVAAMKSRVLRGRKLLRERFEDCCEVALDARGRMLDVKPR
jgi:RNA polymerase sigma-70 factor (ECF subfamily)